MVIIKIFIIIILILFIYYLNKKIEFRKEKFQDESNKIILKGNTSSYTDIDIENGTKINLNPNFIDDNININVEKDIIVKDSIKINGQIFDINALRYIKTLPINYEEKICLSDKLTGEVDCIDKNHIDMMNGRLPLNVITYPDNHRKCINAQTENFVYNWDEDPEPYSFFSVKDCEDGDNDSEFYIKRTDHTHDDVQTHYHVHSIDTEEHSLLGQSPPTRPISQYDGIPIDDLTNPLEENYAITIAYNPDMGLTQTEFNELSGSIDDTSSISFTSSDLPTATEINLEQALSLGISEEEFNELDTNSDGLIRYE